MYINIASIMEGRKISATNLLRRKRNAYFSWCVFGRLKEKVALELILKDEISVREMHVLRWCHKLKNRNTVNI